MSLPSVFEPFEARVLSHPFHDCSQSVLSQSLPGQSLASCSLKCVSTVEKAKSFVHKELESVARLKATSF